MLGDQAGCTLSYSHTLCYAGSAGVGVADGITSDRQVAQKLLKIPLEEEPIGAEGCGTFLFKAQFQLPVSARPFQLIKAHDPDLADALYLCGDCRIRAAISDAVQLSESMLGKSTQGES